MAKPISTEDFLVQNGIYSGSINCTNAINEIKTGEYLTANNIKQGDLTVEGRKNARLQHHLDSRTLERRCLRR